MAGRRLLWVAFGLFLYTAVGFFVLQDDFVPPAKPINMLAEFFSRLVFTTSGNIEPDSTPAEWFVNSIGAIWLDDDPDHRRRVHLLEPPAPSGARRRTPGCAACCASTRRRTSSGC